MEINDGDSKEFGEFPNSALAENVNDSLVEYPVNEEKQVDNKARDCISSKWDRPISKVYSDNFRFCVNGYQPMIDFLDYKDSGGRIKNCQVHLPYLEERGITKYSSSNPIKLYENSDIDRFIRKGEKIRSLIEKNDASGANSLLNRTHSTWSMTKKAVQQVKSSCFADPREKLYKSYYDDYLTSFLDPSLSLENMPLLSSLGVDPIVASRVAQCKIEHENSMVTRRSRNDDIDKHFDDTMCSMRHTVECIPQPSFSARGPYGEVLAQDCFTNADDMVMRNRFRREEDMNSLKAHVDRITRYDDSRNQLRSYQGLEEGELQKTLSSLRKRQANTTNLSLGAQLNRIQADKTIRKPYSSAIDDLDDDVFLDYLMKRQYRPATTIDYRVPLSELRYKADNISEVQERVHSRAKEMLGETAETRKIRERSKYLNVMDPTPAAEDFNLLILPTRTEINIDHMARSLASRGIARRRFNVDEELDGTFSDTRAISYIDNYIRDAPKPADKLASDYARVRDAESRAKERTALLGL